MKKSILAMAALAVMGINLESSWASKGGGNGGVSVVCRNNQGNILKAELLDTFEMRNMYGLTQKTFSSEAEALKHVLDRLNINKNYKNLFEEHYKRISSNTIILEEGVQISPTEDAFPILKDKNCEFEQLAVYTEDDLLLVDPEIYKSLNGLNRIALKVHETVYFLSRMMKNDESSKISRKITSHLISKEFRSDNLQKLLNRYVKEKVILPETGVYKTDRCQAMVEVKGPHSVSVTFSDLGYCSFDEGQYDFNYDFKSNRWESLSLHKMYRFKISNPTELDTEIFGVFEK